MILIDEIWLARDGDSMLYGFSRPPTRIAPEHGHGWWEGDVLWYPEGPDIRFPEITWESEPKKMKMFVV